VTSLFVIGWGRVGSALGTQAGAGGIRLVGVETRDRGRARRARREVGKDNVPIAKADLVALAVPDAAIAAVASRLAPRLRRGQLAFHLNGSVDLASLAPLAEAGALTGSLHPYCSVASTATPLRGAACAIEGGPRAREMLRRLARATGMRPLARPPRDRLRYHLSAVLTVAAAGVSAAASQRLLEAAGASPPEAQRAISAILHSVAFNLGQDSPGAALTGPFARGDLERIRVQLSALTADPDAADLYRVIGRLSAHLAPGLAPEQRAALEALLSS
jgi:predicted short-subunit dehydrogenase-like oxidoreductase (DUF2520 family)